GWRRMKNHKFDDSNTGLPITAIILAGQGFMARLCKADLVSCSAAATCVGILCDAGYGPNGTLRAKNAFESLIQQVAAAVADNRTADVDLLTHHGRSPTLEQICTTFTGFSAPPQTSPQQKSTKSSNPWAKSYNWWDQGYKYDWRYSSYNNYHKGWHSDSWDKTQNKSSGSSTTKHDSAK
ncbi:hypothetical protein FOZ63_007859, partial [Perkinsus olseni]